MFRVFIRRPEGPATHTLSPVICACDSMFIGSAVRAHAGPRTLTGVVPDKQGVAARRAKPVTAATGLSHNFRVSLGNHGNGYLTRLKSTHVLHHGAVLQEITDSEER